MWDFIVKYWLEFAFGLVVAGLSAGYAHLAGRYKAERKKNEAIENGIRAMMRIQILDTYERCISDGRVISVSKKDAINDLYNSYAALGDTDATIQQVHQEIVQMKLV